MIDLLLVQPPLSREERYGVLSAGGSSLPPFGLAWLAATAREMGFTVAILDGEVEGLGEEGTIDKVLAARAKVVGFTATTISIGRAGNIAKGLKKRGYEGKILIGGAHVTAVPEKTMQAYEAFDVAILGEGEATLRELLPLLLDGGGIDGVAGLAVRQDKEIKRTPPRPFLELSELASLPLPAFDLLPPLTKAYQPSALRTHRLPSCSLVTTRGCGGQCTFCDNTVFGRRIRAFPAEYITEMVARLVKDFGVRDLTFYDDNFVVNRKRLKHFCSLLEKEKFDLTWSCNARVDVITKELIETVKAAGCWQMSVGIESGVQQILDRECKGITIEQVKKAVSLLSANGIKTKGFFMVGHPGETYETAEQTIRFALDLPLDDFQMSFLTPFPGTCIYHEVEKWGTLSENWEEMNMWTPVFIPKGMTREELVTLQSKAMRSFYLRPRIMWRYLMTCLTKPSVIGAVFRGGMALLGGIFSKERAGRKG